MLTTLNTSYTDTRAADLAWALGREPLPALATLDLELSDAKMQLRLLGASHQVLLEEEQGCCSETVACIPGSSTRSRWASPNASAPGSTSSRPASRCSRPASSRAVPRNSWPSSPSIRTASCGVFPGSPHAFTALLAHRGEGQVHWRTWHAYPQDGQLVATRTRVGMRARSGDADPSARAFAGGV